MELAPTHKCGKDVHKVAQIFFRSDANTWWMEMGFASCAIEYCPFCGVELRKEQE